MTTILTQGAGFYYLNSRYYNPEIGRFINADGLVGPVGGILTHNMYAYTANNPVMYVDPSGAWLFPVLAVIAVVIVVYNVVKSVQTSNDLKEKNKYIDDYSYKIDNMNQDETLNQLNISDTNRDEGYKSLVELDKRASQYVESQKMAIIADRSYKSLAKAFKKSSITGQLIIPATNFLGDKKARSQISIEEANLLLTLGEQPNLIDYYNSRVVYWYRYYNE